MGGGKIAGKLPMDTAYAQPAEPMQPVETKRTSSPSIEESASGTELASRGKAQPSRNAKALSHDIGVTLLKSKVNSAVKEHSSVKHEGRSEGKKLPSWLSFIPTRIQHAKTRREILTQELGKARNGSGGKTLEKEIRQLDRHIEALSLLYEKQTAVVRSVRAPLFTDPKNLLGGNQFVTLGDQLKVIDSVGGKYKVQTQDGRTGWILKRTIFPEAVVLSSEPGRKGNEWLRATETEIEIGGRG